MGSRRLPALLLGLLLAAIVAGIGGLSFERKIQSFQPLGFELAGKPGSWTVRAVDSPATGLRPGDRLVLLDGSEVQGDAAEWAARLRAHGQSSLVVLREERLTQVSYLRPPLRIDWAYLILALIAGAYLLIGLYTLRREAQTRPARLFFLWCLASAAIYLISPVAYADRWDRAMYLTEEIARLLLPPLTLHLFLVFPRPLAGFGKRLAPFLYLPAAALLALQADLVFAGGRWIFGAVTPGRVRALDRIEILHLALYAAAAIVTLLLRLRRHREWEERRQVQWVAAGFAAGYSPFLLLYAAPFALKLTPPPTITVLAVGPLALVPLAFAWAILRYKLWDIGVIVRDVATYTVTLLLGAIGFSLLSLGIERGLPAEMAATRSALSFVSGLVMAALLVPTKRGVESALERLQYRGSFSKRRALADLGRELLHDRDLERLCAVLLAGIREGLEIGRVNLLLARGGRLLPVRGETALLGGFAPDALGDEFWQRDAEPLVAVGLPGPAGAAERILFAAGYRYALPLQVRDSRVGALLLGYAADDEPLSSDDLELLRSLLNQAALAIENAQLVDQLHRQLEELVRLERHSEGIIESSPAGIAVLDEDDRVVSANLALAALGGLERAAALGRRVTELLPLGTLPEAGAVGERAFTDSDGRERHLQISVAPLGSGATGAQRVLVVQDTSERVAMERALEEKDRLASLGMLAAGVAHEVNTPITGISSYAQMLLAETATSDPRYELLKKVERQTFRAARIVNSLLSFARKREHEAEPLDLAALLGECAELLRERMSKRDVRLEWTPPREDCTVVGNDGELQQVFTNLMLNAIDAMAERGTGGTLTLRMGATGERVCVAVEDDGPGIPPELAEKVFQPFFTTKLGRGGTGLGLAISYDLVRRHGGELKLDNRPGGGCRFLIELPHAARRGAPGAA
ncbi:MAG: ATP-binding protein [Acidobacteriota bacterium]